MTDLIYCATPSRLSDYTKIIQDFVAKKGLAPFHPFPAMPREHFEDGIVGRERTLEYCLRMVDACDRFWMFGVSDGTLFELKRAIVLGKPIEVHFSDWSPGDKIWREEYSRLERKYGKILDSFIIG